MLNTKVDEILYRDGKVVGIKNGEEEAKAPLIICDPSYVLSTVSGKVRETGKVIRAICILDHPIPNTNDATSIQIILPQKQLNRNCDVYISMVSSAHAVCSKGLYIAMVSTTVETPNPEQEIVPALDLLGSIIEMFVQVQSLYEPCDDGTNDNLFVTRSYDASSHFETATDEILEIYTRITGETLDMNIEPSEDEEY